MFETNFAVKNEFMAALGAGDTATIAKCMHPDAVIHQAAAHPYGGDHHGADGFLKLIDQIMKAYQIEAMENTHTFRSDDPNHLALEFSMKGKVAATGEPFVSTVIEHWTFKDGKIYDVKPHWFNIPAHSK